MGFFKNITSSKLIRHITLHMIIIELLCILATSFACYFVLWPRLKDTAINSTVNTTDEICSQIDNYITNLTDASLFIADSNELKNALSAYHHKKTSQNYNLVCLALNSLCSKMSNIRSTIVTTDDGNSFNSITNITAKDQQIVELFQDSSFKSSFSGIYTLDTQPETYALCYMYRRPIQNVTYNFYFFYKVNSIINTATRLSAGYFDCFALYEIPETIFYSQNMHDPFNEYIKSSENSAYTDVIAQDGGYYFTHAANSYNWCFTAYASNSTINAPVIQIFFLVLLFGIIFSTAALSLTIITISRFIAPLNQLNGTMLTVAEGNLNIHSEIHTGDEIENLSKIFNTMLDSINKHIEFRITAENKEQRMKYNLLIAQIDSHFIGNTMSTINSMARKDMMPEIIEANTALIKIIQDCLRVKTYAITDTIEQELDILRQYLIIERLRYKNDAQLIIEVPNELLHYEMPKSILQPIVENSLLHGLMDLETGKIEGLITLVIFLKNDLLNIEITDNGKSVDLAKLMILNSMDDYMDYANDRGKHIGLINIRKRLTYIYNGKATIEFHNKEGFSVIIKLPILSEG